MNRYCERKEETPGRDLRLSINSRIKYSTKS